MRFFPAHAGGAAECDLNSIHEVSAQASQRVREARGVEGACIECRGLRRVRWCIVCHHSLFRPRALEREEVKKEIFIETLAAFEAPCVVGHIALRRSSLLRPSIRRFARGPLPRAHSAWKLSASASVLCVLLRVCGGFLLATPPLPESTRIPTVEYSGKTEKSTPGQRELLFGGLIRARPRQASVVDLCSVPYPCGAWDSDFRKHNITTGAYARILTR